VIVQGRIKFSLVEAPVPFLQRPQKLGRGNQLAATEHRCVYVTCMLYRTKAWTRD